MEAHVEFFSGVIVGFESATKTAWDPELLHVMLNQNLASNLEIRYFVADSVRAWIYLFHFKMN